ncbi:hypothetical protein PFISCL1PPCAC_4511, partial [Pristionchus fissidentatus]
MSLQHVYKVIRFYSFWKTCTSFHRIVTMIDKVTDDLGRSTGSAGSSTSSTATTSNPEFKKRLFVQYLWRNAKAIEKARVQKEFDPRRQRLLRFVNDPKSKRKAFMQQPSTSTKKGIILEDDDIVLHYGDGCSEPLPVFSVDKPPMDSTSTLTNTLRCPVKFISKVSSEEILSDTRWWKQTSASTRFYQSDTLRTFHPVTMLHCRGEMRSAYRSRARGGGLQSVPLVNVYRVARHFGYWHTCHAFHRIISVISPVTSEGQIACGFKQRIFVQYFWRHQKESDRARVQKEYNDSRSRLSAPLPSTSSLQQSRSTWNHNHHIATRCNSREDILATGYSTSEGTLSPPLPKVPRRPPIVHPRRDRAMSLTPTTKLPTVPRLSIDSNTLGRRK